MGEREAYRRRQLTESYWPAETSVPVKHWSLGDALRNAAAAVPDRLALVEGNAMAMRGRTWTYAALLEDAERMAAALLTRFKPGDRVAMCANNIPEWMILLYGCALAGMTLVTVNPACKMRELRHILGKSGAVGLFLIDEFRGVSCQETMAAIRPELPALREIIRIADLDAFVAQADLSIRLPVVDPRDPCLILFTSGTTGLQKGVVFHHEGVANMSWLTHARGGLADGGVFINPMPMFYIGGLGHAGVGAVMHRSTHVLVSHWDPELYMALTAREKGTYSLMVPTMIEAVLAHPARQNYDLSTLKHLISGASVVEASLIRRTWSAMGSTICNVYGQTEMEGVVTSTHRDDTEADQTGTIGQPLAHFEVKIADPETGAVLPIGAEGEIWVRGHQIMLGYFDMPEETARTIRADGWLVSGDLARMDARGFITITGRIKDMIIRGGENVYPREVENLLLEYPGIANVAVVGIPDPYWGEKVGAVIIPTSPDDVPDPDAMQAFCRANLAHYKAPCQWYLTDIFPFTDTGKLQKYRLLDGIANGEIRRLNAEVGADAVS